MLQRGSKKGDEGENLKRGKMNKEKKINKREDKNQDVPA
jgi:hypothetical protein